jgi:xanthine dehydrogenase/oxidase
MNGQSITTVEGIGSSKKGFHPVQQRLAECNGSQCGWCSPGMVMSMYSLLEENSQPTSQEIEDRFDGNLCRCTGYRQILDAMQTVSSEILEFG